MNRYASIFAIRRARWVFGLNWFGREAVRPAFEAIRHCERGGCYWHANALGLSLWYDSTPPMTVGERGVW